MEPGFIVLGLIVGALVGMTGVGAGSLVTPALVFSGVPPAIAVGTDLAYAALTKTAGAAVHRARGSLDLGIALTAIVLLVGRPRLAAVAARYEERIAPLRGPLTVAAGALIGVLVALSSVGAGALAAAVMVMLHPSLPAARIAGTDIAHAVPLTLAAALGHVWLGTVDYLLAASLLAGSVPGIVVGSLAAGRLPEALVRRLLAAALLYAGSRLAAASF